MLHIILFSKKNFDKLAEPESPITSKYMIQRIDKAFNQ
jgi:hypothetical protein